MADWNTLREEIEMHLRPTWISHTSVIVAAELEGLEMVPAYDRPYAGMLKLGKRRPGYNTYN